MLFTLWHIYIKISIQMLFFNFWNALGHCDGVNVLILYKFAKIFNIYNVQMSCRCIFVRFKSNELATQGCLVFEMFILHFTTRSISLWMTCFMFNHRIILWAVMCAWIMKFINKYYYIGVVLNMDFFKKKFCSVF